MNYPNHLRDDAGFTFIELIVTVSITILIIGLSTVYLWGIGQSENVLGATRQTMSTIHEAKVNAIAGKSASSQPTRYGIRFTANSFTLFQGSSFNQNDSNNQLTTLPSGITFTQINLPTNDIIFDNITGEVANYSATQNYVVLQDSNTGINKKIIISKIGEAAYQ